MPQLFVLSGPLVGRTFDVSGPVVLGRDPGCGVVLAHRSVSREHARIEPDGAGWSIVDLGSRNGTKVGGERVERAPLRDLDELTLGELLLRFRTVRAEEEPLPAPLTAGPVPPAPPPPAAPLEDEGGGFELEEEIELAPPPPSAAQPQRPAAELTERDRERARILATGSRSGVFSGDLAQWPAAMRLGAYLGVLLVLGAAFYGAFWLVAKLRGG